MGQENYKKRACKLLGVQFVEQNGDASGDGLLEIGSFKIIESDDALDQAIDARLKKISEFNKKIDRDYDAKIDALKSESMEDYYDTRDELYERKKVEQKRITTEAVFRYADYLNSCGKTDALAKKHDVDIRFKDTDNDYDYLFMIDLKKALEKDLVRRFNSYKHTPDREGYRAYLKEKLPSPKTARHDQKNSGEGNLFYKDVLEANIPFVVPETNHTEHLYCVATTKMGKTELLKTFTHELLKADNSSLVFIDPAGDVSNQIAHWRDHELSGRLVYLDPFLKAGHSFVLNPFDALELSDSDKLVMAQEIVAAIEDILSEGKEPNLTGNMRTVLIPSVRLLLDLPATDMDDLRRLMLDDPVLLQAGQTSKHPEVAEFFQREFVEVKALATTKDAIAVRISRILGRGNLRNLICGRSSLNLEKLLANKKIVVLNLAQGRMGLEEAQAFGKIMVSMIQGIALRRIHSPEKKRPQTHMIIDECQNFITPNIIKIIEEGRKFGLSVWLAQLSVGAGMDTDFAHRLTSTTNVKIVGRSNAVETSKSGVLVGVDAGRISSLDRGQFIYKVGNRKPIIFRASTKLLGYKNAMPSEIWANMKKIMLKHFYRPIENHSEPRETPANAGSLNPTGSWVRKRKLK